MELVAKSASGAGLVTVDPNPLGKGGEGSVYSVLKHSVDGLPPASELVVKLYHEPSAGNRRRKIVAMLQSPPQNESVAWPLAVAFNSQKEFVGYLMVKLQSDKYRMWANISHASERKSLAGEFDVRYALNSCKNLAIALYSVHSAGHRVGDVNESNIFIADDSRILLVDTDSAQIKAQDGTIFPCEVGKAEYTAPELTHGALRDQERTEASDVFAFGISLFQMLTGGAHPTDGGYAGDGEPPSQVERVRNGWYPGVNPQNSGPLAPVPRIASDGIPKRVLQVIGACLRTNPAQRPPLDKVIAALDDVVNNLQQCRSVGTHWFDPRDGACLWCNVANANRPDPWSTKRPASGLPLPSQTALPSVSFGAQGSAAPVQRAAPAVAGQQAANAHQAAGGQAVHNPNNIHQLPPPPQQQQGYTPQQQQQPQQPTVEEVQKAYRTRKTILTDSSGNMYPRPPLGALFRSNPRLAWSCMVDEAPKATVFWWPTKRKVGTALGLGLGFVVSALMAVLWFLTLPSLAETYLPSNAYLQIGVQYAIYGAVGLTALVGVLQPLLGLLDQAKLKKKHGDLTRFKREKAHWTVLRSVAHGLVYGPGFLLFLVAMITMAIFELLGALTKSR